MTTIGDMFFHLGGIPVGGSTLPPMGRSSSTGASKAIFVHGSLGLAGADGSYKHPVKTLTQAYALCEDGRGDTVYILNDGSTTATVRDVALTWAKDNCHIVGLCAPGLNRRARISPPTTDATDVDAYTPYLTLSASGCSVINVSWFQGNAEDSKASVGIKVSGSRNYFKGVDIITGAAAHQGDEAGTINLQVTGSENIFEDCYIGQDTAARSNANCNVRFGSGASDQATRNVFRNCIFPCFADATTPVWVSAPTAFDTQRWNLFQDCVFINTGTSTLAAGVTWTDTTGICLMKDCAFYGMTNVTAADNAYVQLYGISSALGVVDVGFFKGVDIA